MTRGEVWWAQLEGAAGRRPVVIVTRDRAIQVRSHVTVVPVTSTIRDLPTEVSLGAEEGLRKPCVANADSVLTIRKARLIDRISQLPTAKLIELNRALRFALALE
ncbi:MAG: type II toxin-antitoxin system PemK/MazF family toxin [Elusimicrobia bacterium]|nr:type II toxin-antitoxin system PemK/MazF family toxin [Elusimicrobiota bacterium]